MLPVMPSLDLDSIAHGGVEVVGFGVAVQVFSSKQKPKAILVVGDDLQTRKLLVKVTREKLILDSTIVSRDH